LPLQTFETTLDFQGFFLTPHPSIWMRQGTSLQETKRQCNKVLQILFNLILSKHGQMERKRFREDRERKIWEFFQISILFIFIMSINLIKCFCGWKTNYFSNSCPDNSMSDDVFKSFHDVPVKTQRNKMPNTFVWIKSKKREGKIKIRAYGKRGGLNWKFYLRHILEKILTFQVGNNYFSEMQTMFCLTQNIQVEN